MREKFTKLIKRIQIIISQLRRKKDYETNYSNKYSNIVDSQIIYTNRYNNFESDTLCRLYSNIIIEFTLEEGEYVHNHISFIKSTNINFRYMTLLDQYNVTRLYLSGSIDNYIELILKYINTDNIIIPTIFELIKTLPKDGFDILIKRNLLSENDFALENNYNFYDTKDEYMKSIAPYKDYQTTLKRFDPYTYVANIIELDHIEFVFKHELNISEEIILQNSAEIMGLANIIFLYSEESYINTPTLPKHIESNVKHNTTLLMFRLDSCMYHCSYDNTWNWNMSIYMKEDNLGLYFNLFKKPEYNIYDKYSKYLTGSNYMTDMNKKTEYVEYVESDENYYEDIDEAISDEEYEG